MSALRSRRWRLRATLLAGAAVGLMAPAEAQRALTLSFQEQTGSARIIAKWADGAEVAPQATASVADQVLILKFSEKVKIDLDALKRGLPNWAALAKLDSDGMTARIGLTRDAKVRISTSIDLAAFDLISPDSKSTPPAVVSPLLAKRQEAAVAAKAKAEAPVAATEMLEVRGSDAGPSSRIAFYWPRPTSYRVVESKPGYLKLLFARGAKADLAYLHIDPPDNLADFQGENTPRGYQVTVTSKDGLPIKHFIDGDTPTIDITRADPEMERQVAEIAEAQKPKPKPTAPRAGEVMARPDKSQVSLQNSAPLKPGVEAGRPLLLAPPAPEKLALMPATAAAPVALGSGKRETTMTTGWRDPAPRNGIVDVKALPLANGVDFQLTFAAPTPAAIFSRGGATWAVFGANADLKVDPVTVPTGYRVRTFRQKDATMLRIESPKGIPVSALVQDAVWTIHFAATAQRPSRFLKPARVMGDNGRMRVEAMMIGTAGLVWFEDPIVGDRMVAAVAYGPTSASLQAQDYVEAQLPATAHGLAIAPRSDDVDVSLEGEKIVVSFAGQAQTALEVKSDTMKPTAPTRPAFVDFVKYRSKTGEEFFANRSKVELAATQHDGETPEGSAAMMELARFYLGNELVPEALGVLREASRVRPDVEQDANFLGLRGAANVLARRFKQADEDLAKGPLREDPSAALWRGLIAVERGEWERASEFFRAGQSVVYSYSPAWSSRFAAAAAEAALNTNDYDVARRFAEMAVDGVKGKGESAERGQMVLASLSAIVDGPGPAYEKFAKLAKDASEPIAARAELRRLELGVAAGRMTANQAAGELDSLRFRWRGDDLEMQTVGILADQYMRVGRFRDALALAKSAALRDADAPGARDLRIKLSEYFRRLFLDGEVDRLDPIQALALFYEFKELQPPGVDGDQMTRKLAQRLVAFDLLEPAAALLQYQVDERMRGVAKSAVAVDLATIYLRDRRPDKALQAINSTRQPALPPELTIQRRLLEAAAYRDLGRYDHTVELVEPLDGMEAKSLLADAYWRDHKWPEAAKTFAQMLALNDPKSANRADLALKAAIAARMAQDPALLADLRKRYASLLDNSPNKASFDLITAATDIAGASLQEAVKRMADAPRVDAFEAAMKKRFETPRTAAPAAGSAEAKPAAKTAGGSR